VTPNSRIKKLEDLKRKQRPDDPVVIRVVFLEDGEVPPPPAPGEIVIDCDFDFLDKPVIGKTGV
jgi:hypothetical protein